MIDTIIFDLDGTLLDTLGDLRASVNKTLRNHGYPERTHDEIKRFIGNGAKMLIKRSFPADIGEKELDGFLEEYKACYSANICVETKPYAYCREIIASLVRDGFKLAVVSNKPENDVKMLIAHFFGDDIKATTGDLAPFAVKPAPDNVIRALEMLGSDKSTTVIVGDGETDIKTAKNINILSIGVDWGFRPAETLKDAGADYIVSSPKELYELLLRLR